MDIRDEIQRQIDRAISTTVGISDRFIPEHFSIRRVIADLKSVWNDRLKKEKSSGKLDELKSHFEEFFGFVPMDPDEVTQEFGFPETEDFVLRMAASLAANCKPYWILRDESDKAFSVALFLPTKKTAEEAQDAIQSLLRENHVTIEIYPEDDSATDKNANPFLILAFSHQGTNAIEKIQSLDYYTQPGVFQLLQATESKKGETIFAGGNTGGLGYVDPLYLNEARLSTNRWHPWVPKLSISQAQAVEAEVLDSLLYAMFPGEAKALADLHGSLAKLGWDMPLVKNKGHNAYVFTRLPLTWQGGRAQVDNAAVAEFPVWKADNVVSSRAGLPSVVEAITLQTELRQRLRAEAETFWDKVLPAVNVARGTPAFVTMVAAYTDWVRDNFVKGDKADANTDLWQKLLERINQFLTP